MKAARSLLSMIRRASLGRSISCLRESDGVELEGMIKSYERGDDIHSDGIKLVPEKSDRLTGT